MAKCNTSAKEFTMQEDESWKQYDKRIDALFNALMKVSNELPEDKLIGRLISFPIADGKTWYSIYKEKPLELVHIPIGDGYGIPDAHIRGLNLTEIKRMVKADIALAKLFS